MYTYGWQSIAERVSVHLAEQGWLKTPLTVGDSCTLLSPREGLQAYRAFEKYGLRRPIVAAVRGHTGRVGNTYSSRRLATRNA